LEKNVSEDAQIFNQLKFHQLVKDLPDECFYGCSSLSSIIFPGQIESIGNECFYECSNLQSIEIPISVREINPNQWYEYSCFEGCNSLQNMSFVNISFFVSSDFRDSPFYVGEE
jgi:hypothetical protein